MELKESNLPSSPPAALATLEDKQRRRMVIALALLLLALIVVLIKDRQFWFSSTPAPETTAEETPGPPTPAMDSQASGGAARPGKQTQSLLKSKKITAKIPTRPAAPEVEQSQAAAGPVITATNRTVLPPLEIEVVAGNSHRALTPKNNSVNVDMGPNPFAGLGGTPVTAPDNTASSASPAPATDKSDKDETASVPEAPAEVTLPPATAERVSRSVKPGYPVLAKQMKVQGAVVLQALIDRAGGIQELHVVSGPAILATAAEEAVKQWHFKPYYQQGQAVETEARITVNFTISTY
jgi:TonB family protein